MDRPNLKHTLSYLAGSVFLVGIIVYLYLMIQDQRSETKHTREENFWIYFGLVILVLGCFGSYYLISKSNTRVNRTLEDFKKRAEIKFVGQNPRIKVQGGGPLRN